MFFGRAEEFQFIKTRLRGQKEGCVILLFGDRRSGKTSILHQVVNGRLGSRFFPVFIDMQGMIVAKRFSVVSGGVGCILITALIALRTPALRSYRR